MNREVRFNRLRWCHRIAKVKASLLVFVVCQFLIFAMSLSAVDTYSYFNAKYSANMGMKNATKDELVEITEGNLIYEDKCIAKQPITVKNIFDYYVKISIGGTNYTLDPEEDITHTQTVADNCEDHGKKSIEIIGYERYFVDTIDVTVDSDKLNPCPPQSENGNGRPNDHGKGKKCGHNEERTERLNENTTTNEQLQSVEEETQSTENENKGSATEKEIDDGEKSPQDNQSSKEKESTKDKEPQKDQGSSKDDKSAQVEKPSNDEKRSLSEETTQTEKTVPKEEGETETTTKPVNEENIQGG